MHTKVEEMERLHGIIAELKIRLEPLVMKHHKLATKHMECLMTQSRVALLNELYQEEKVNYKKELFHLMELKKSNEKWSGRLDRARAKDFTVKQEQVEDRLSANTTKAREQAEQLADTRRSSIEEAAHYIFPIEVQELDDDVESSTGSSLDISMEMVVEGDWLLSAQRSSVQPKMTIVCTPLPADGDYNEYVTAAKKRRKMLAKEAETQQLLHSTTYTISAGMAHIAQYTWLIADILDVHLSYPYSLVTAISDYGQCDSSEQEFRANVVRLNNNVVHLCFMQNVPHSALTIRHTLKNLHALVTHTQLGRSDPYTCDPDLMLHDPGGVAYMESDTQPPATVTASTEGDVFSSTEEQYTGTTHVQHNQPNFNSQNDQPSTSPTQDHTNKSSQLITISKNDLTDGSVSNKTLQATPEGVAASSSMLNTISNLWTSAWGSWQRQ
ncbi:beclin 1-associated autophagy-related key regulator-like isoform X2 [Dysidea avara]|uniref:beclin 1-associated autophagy-related key regulator-like isoform X2 n=1 Tax=Dysidea avara TaxID=196820 RepID=UPI003323FC4E